MSDAPSGLIPDHLMPRPVRGGTHRHLLGLRPLDMKDWFILDADTPALLANRLRLLSAAPDDVFMAEDGTDAAAQELRTMIAANLATHHGIISTSGSGHPLVEAATLVADDLVVVDVTDADPAVRVVAAVVTAPNRWKLGVKFGAGLIDVHRPVPGYAEQVGDVVNTMLTRLDRPVWRSNWGITESPTWYQPAAPHIGLAIRSAEAAAQRLWLRVERQTLVRLPGSGAVVFAIRTFQQQLAMFADRPHDAALFLEAIDQLPGPLRTYKELPRHLPHVRSWLEQCVSRADSS